MKLLLTTVALFIGIQCSIAQTTYNFIPNGIAESGTIQTWIVPNCVSKVRIEAAGAKGGSTNGGNGAFISGDVTVSGGDTLYIVVGQMGTINNCGSSGDGTAGGGGGSFVWKNNSALNRTLLMAAGGGGGGNINFTGTCIYGLPGDTAQSGAKGNSAVAALGGTNGQGGSGTAPSGVGSGGAGWLSNGQNSTFFSPSTGGESWPTFTGGLGSPSYGSSYYTGNGGFGGGGGAVCGGGGGGGYSGGGAGDGDVCRTGGGGGGSFNSGTNKSGMPGANNNHGYVNITILEYENVQSSISPAVDSVCFNTLVTLDIPVIPNVISVDWNNNILNGVPFAIQQSSSFVGIATFLSGCKDTVTYAMGVYPYILPTINYTPGFNPPAILMVTPTFNSYLWSNGETSQSTIVANPGNYTVDATDSHGCVFSTDVDVYFSSGLNDIENSALRIYPNPTSQILKVQFANSVNSSYSAKIVDLLGKVLYVKKDIDFSVGEVQFDVSHLKSGQYYMILENGKQIHKSPFIIK